MSIFGDSSSSRLKMDLKNPNQLRESYILNEVSRLTPIRRKEFATSDVAKTWLEEGIISQNFIDMISNEDAFDKGLEIAACQLAADNDDPLWSELVEARSRERIIMNELLSKYNERAASLDEGMRAKISGYSFIK